MDRRTAYNKKQATLYGWTPEWFGCTEFNEELNQAIVEFQGQNRLKADGYCGPATYRVKFMHIEETGNFIKEHSIRDGDKYIIHADKAFEIFWPKVKLWTEDSKWESKHFRDLSGKPERKPGMFITHWDVCLNSSSCQKVLNKRGLSVHFLIDNDGTIIQTLDTQHVGYHAGSRVNSKSIGVEVSSAYDLKWQRWYGKKGFGVRPIWEATVHGERLMPFLGFYDHQVQALAALWEAVSWATGIPLELPETRNTVDPAVANGTFKGFANHYHITSRKIDCAGLNNEKVLEMAKWIRENKRG